MPVAFAFAVMLGVSILSIFWHHKRKIIEDVKHETVEMKELLPMVLEADSKLMASQIELLQNNKILQKAWLAKDRGLLLKHAMPIFKNIQLKNPVTHFYFHNLDKSCFLRIHNPLRYGDSINRFTLDHTVRNGELTSGIELGPFGTFTLRVVYPWRINGKLTGFIELGEEIDAVTTNLKNILGVELIFLIYKQYLERSKWEEGLRMMGRTGDWDQYPRFVIINQYSEGLPADLTLELKNLQVDHKEKIVKLRVSGKNYCGGFVALIDAEKQNVGDMIVLNDVEKDEASSRLSLIVQTAICAFISLLLFTFFYFYIGRLEKSIVKTNNDLKTEIEDRKHAEDELKKYQGHLQELVEQKTTNLKKSNEQLQQEITSRKKAQEELQRLNQELEQRVEKRTQELMKTREALFQKEKLAVMGQLASCVGHELRNPLAVINNACYFLKMKFQSSSDEAVEDNINIIVREIATASKIVSDILDFSRIKLPVRQDIDINQLVKETLSRCSIPENITVSTDFSHDFVSVSIDPVQVGQIFANMIDNAAQAMKKGGTLKISTRAFNGNVDIIFVDEGCGIPDDNLDQIFEPLFTSKENGIGLGLAICKNLAQANRGKVMVESTVGRGSKFTVRFFAKG